MATATAIDRSHRLAVPRVRETARGGKLRHGSEAKLAIVRPSGAEAMRAAIRRSLPIVVALVLVGAAALNVFKQLQGPVYTASAKVYHSPTALSAALTNIDAGFVDPEREMATALTLARSREPYKRAAPGVGSSVSDLRGSVSVGGHTDEDIIAFTASTDSEAKSISYANAVADAYVDWRSDIQTERVTNAIRQVQGQLANSGRNRPQLQEQLSRLQVLKTLSEGGAVVVERATDATQTSPAPVRDTMLGAALGFIVALLVAGAREAFNTRVRSEADVEDALEKPVLATIQSLPRRAGIVAAASGDSRWSDTYALLAANLIQLLGSGNGSTVLAVTSSVAGEGKTTTASNLAVAMAARGQRVILAEFDLRKPTVARLFHIPSDSPGIVQVVDGDATVDAASWTVELNGARSSRLRPVVVTPLGIGSEPVDGDGWLRIIPAGGVEPSARVARSPGVRALLDRLRAEADVVILDTPPALAAVEVSELSGEVDGVLVVVRHGRVTRRSLHALGRQAESWRAEIVGAVITGSPAEGDEYYSAQG
jgi:tyrosine-protein kinase